MDLVAYAESSVYFSLLLLLLLILILLLLLLPLFLVVSLISKNSYSNLMESLFFQSL